MKISKSLTKNDLGNTGAHQAGIHVPRKVLSLGIFPLLNTSTKNPRSEIVVVDEERKKWKINLIYYNNKFFGGTRNEVRLTGILSFLKAKAAMPKDIIIFQKTKKELKIKVLPQNVISKKEPSTVVRISCSWRTLKI